MNDSRTLEQEAAEDIFFGQKVIIWARWFVITAGMILVLWSSSSVSQLTAATLLFIPLIAFNFFVHGRYLMERPVNRALLFVLSLVDLGIVTVITLTWQDQTGLDSHFFIFYYPVILAFAFVFTPRTTLVFTVTALVSYVVACLIEDPAFVSNSMELERLVIRLITLASMGGLATYFWRIQRDRRRSTLEQFGLPEMQLGS